MKNNNITSFSQLLDEKYGPLGSPKRTEWQQQFEAFKIGGLIEEARKKTRSYSGRISAQMRNQQVVYFTH